MCIRDRIQGTQALIHYIEGFISQLVEDKTLNLVDVGSSPMVEITSYDVIINELYTKSQLSIILLSRPLGATRCCSKFTRLYLQSPCSLLHNDPALGGYTGWSFHKHKAITSPRLLQAWQPSTWGLHNMEYSVFTSDWDEQYGFLQSGSIYIEASLKMLLCYLLKTWGLQVIGI